MQKINKNIYKLLDNIKFKVYTKIIKQGRTAKKE